MINLLDEIGKPGFQSAAFLTYGVDLGFFEAKVMNRLLDTGCRNTIVLADGHQSKDALNSATQLRYVGVQCPLVTVRLGNSAFHSKAALMVGEENLKVLVGSGNLTIPGYTRNWELFTKLEGREAAGAALELLNVFRDAAAWSPLKPAFDAWRKRLESSTPWLFGEEPGDQAVRFFSSQTAAILPQAKKELDGRVVDEIFVASPFFDADASALRWMVDNFSPKKLTLLVEDGAHLDPACVAEVLATMGGESSVRRFVGTGRPLHGKLILFRGTWGEALLGGSPNLSSAALLRRASRSGGNFELATFRLGSAGEFSALVDAKIGEQASLQHINTRRPNLIGPATSPLELEAAWISEGHLFVFPAEGEAQNQDGIDVVVGRGSHDMARLRLHKVEDGSFSQVLPDHERLRLERAPSQARMSGAHGKLGAPTWVQNLDAVEKRANPVQRPKYAKGLRALENDSLGPDWESWNSLFEAFSAFSNSWLRYADSRRSSTPKPTEPKTGSQPAWDPNLFYISRDEVTLELPRYFANVENTGVAIGDFEYLIAALPSATKAIDDGATYAMESTEAAGVDEILEDEDVENESTGAGDDEPPHPGLARERPQWLRDRLHRKFRSLVESYEGAIGIATVQNTAEASYLCLSYTGLQKAIMVSARESLLDASQLRGLASRLTAAWTTELWAGLSDKEDLEDRLACAATSLATIATVTSPWLRQLAGGTDMFDYDLYKQLREPLRELKPTFLTLRETYECGNESSAWENLVEEYNRLRHVELEERFFASWTPLQVLDDLAARYEAWHLNEVPLWQRVAYELGVGEAALRDGDVIRVQARLPHIGDQERCLSRLLYSIHEGTQDPAAVLWDNEDASGNIERKAMVLCPELNAVSEISFFHAKRPLLRLHRVVGGSAGSGVHLAKSRYETVAWKQGSIHPSNYDQTTLLECVATLLPELPVVNSPLAQSP